MSDDHRLSRIESKLDRLTDAMTSLVRMEERVVTIFARLDMVDARQVEAAKRLSQVETDMAKKGHVLGFAERLFWIVVTAGVALGFAKMRGHV